MKHTYGKTKKRSVKSISDYDPRPEQFRGTAKQHLPVFLSKVRGEQLCISLLLDPSFCNHDEVMLPSQASPRLPDVTVLKETIASFKQSLALSEAEVRAIEQSTKEQRRSPQWFEARRFRLTSSLFGAVMQRRATTPPDNLVLRIIQPKEFRSNATDWGIDHEPIALKEYIAHQQSHGHKDLYVAPSGFLVSHSHPFLGSSPDGAVFDPSTPEIPYGFLEIKCPYAFRNISPLEACSESGFFGKLEKSSGGVEYLSLSPKHSYYAQVQGQMAIGDRPWCDFVVYTLKGLSVTRISFNEDYWNNSLLPKLTSFYDNCVAPEIVSPVHVLGIPMRDLSK